MNKRLDIQQMIRDFLSTSNLEQEIQTITLELLHREGKVFSSHPTNFTWGEYTYFILSLLTDTTSHVTKVKQAVGIELLMLATDLFDDLVDDDHVETSVTSKSHLLMMGNILLNEALYLLSQYKDAKRTNRLTIIYQHLRNAGNGQWRDFHFVIGQELVNEEHYFHIVRQKSCSFFQLISELYGSYTALPTLQEITTYIGYAAQLRNDMQDIMSDKKSDLFRRKAVLPLIKAVMYSDEKDGGWLLKQLQSNDDYEITTEQLKRIREYIRKTGAMDYCAILANYYIEKAKTLLRKHFQHKKADVERLIQLLD